MDNNSKIDSYSNSDNERIISKTNPEIKDFNQPVARQLKLSLLTSIALIFLTGTSIFFAYLYFQTTSNQKQNTNSFLSDQNQGQSPIPTPSLATPPSGSPITPQLLFSKDPDRNISQDLQTWLINLDGSNARQLQNIGGSTLALKYPSSSNVFFIDEKTPENLSILNLITNQVKQHQLISHPNPEVFENASLRSIEQISPNERFVVYEVFFTIPCPEISQPEGFQGGSGPCTPDPNPQFPDGYYLLDLSTSENTYLKTDMRVSRWHEENNLLYYIDNTYQKNGLFSLDLITRATTLVHKADTFVYASFPLFKSDRLIRNEGTTGDTTGQISLSELSIVNMKTNQIEVIASGRWADIQPFVSISPEEDKFLFVRTHLFNGIGVDSLYLYDMANKQSKQITPNVDNESYSIKGTWIDNDSFVTLVDTIEPTGYYNGNNYLVKMNTNTGEIVRLTQNDDVYRFLEH